MQQPPEPSPDTVDFGFTAVPTPQKRARVRAVFDSVAPHYDLMNDLMSLGLHRLWKRFAVALAAPMPGERILDLAGGTGDLARLMAPRVGPGGQVLVGDINAAMLTRGRDRLLDDGLAGNLGFVLADAEHLPLADASLDCVTMAFGLRNVTDKSRALREMRRVLRPGGRALVLEFSTVQVVALKPLYDRYSFSVLPRLGRLVAGDGDSYRYLAESIRRHPDQESLLRMMQEAGFARCRYYNLAGGVVAVHRGYRL